LTVQHNSFLFNMSAQPKTTSSYKTLYLIPFGLLLSVTALRFAVLSISSTIYGRSLSVNGQNSDQFYNVRDVFRNNFAEGLERDGASFAVYHKGQLVVDLWSGTSNTKSGSPWAEDTRTLLFSTTKALSALCIALMVDRGQLDWNDRVVKYWPEYGQNGKQNTTIQQVLSHQAGIPYIDEKILYSDALSIDDALMKIARSTPIWEPGTKTGYHALTWGWIVDGIVRHADPKHRHLSQYFREEIADKYDVDVSIGAETYANYLRSAVLSFPTSFDFIRDTLADLRMLFMIGAYYFQPSNSILTLSAKNPHWLPIDDKNIVFNSYEIQKLKLGSANGLSGARDLAKLFSIFIDGSIVSSSTVDQMSKPVVDSWHLEQVVLYPIMKGFGFFYEYHPTRTGKFVFGHPGLGCQSLYIDVEEQLVVAYLSNGLKSSTSILCLPYQRLLQTVYTSL